MLPCPDIVVVAEHVPAVVVVHKPIGVVVDAIVGNLCRVHPVVLDKVDVVVIGPASLKDGHHNARAARRGAPRSDVPCKVRVDVVVTIFNVVPLTVDLGIVGQGFTARHFVVELRSFHPPIFSQFSQDGPVLSGCPFLLEFEPVNVCPGRKHIYVPEPMLLPPFLCILVLMEHHQKFSRQMGLPHGCQ